LSKKTLNKEDHVELRFQLKNTGIHNGEEIVQLYIRDLVSSVTRPVKELKGFKKIGLKAGEMKTVELKLSTDDLKFYDKDMNYVIEAGEFELMIGASSEDIRLTEKITVID